MARVELGRTRHCQPIHQRLPFPSQSHAGFCRYPTAADVSSKYAIVVAFGKLRFDRVQLFDTLCIPFNAQARAATRAGIDLLQIKFYKLISLTSAKQ